MPRTLASRNIRDYMVDLLANAINTIRTSELVGKDQCIVPNTKLIKTVLDVMKENGYVSGYAEFMDNNAPKITITLSKDINKIGVVRPRFAVRLEDLQRFETRYIPSKDFGILIISTSKGIMTNRSAKENKIGGRLLAYVY